MGVEMGTYLRETLRSLCRKTKWKYAVFWKLKHRGRMNLTWEDAYYNNHELPDHSENMCYIDTLVDFNDGRYQQDPLGLALAKMTYAVYPFGEGIIGQVAASGTHQWTFADRPASGSRSSSKYCDGWQTQFSSGIRTIAVVAVTPLGVVQLGSLDTVFEDLNLVSHIKDTFYSLQIFSLRFLPDATLYSMKSTSSLSEIPKKTSDVEIIKDCLGILDEGVSIIKPDTQPNSLPCFEKLNNIPRALSLCDLCPKEAVEMVDKQKCVQMKLLEHKKCGEDTNGWKDVCVRSGRIHPLMSHDFCTVDTNLNNFMLESGVHFPFHPAESVVSKISEGVKCDRIIHLENEGLHAPQPFEIQRGKGLEHKLELQTEIEHVDTLNNPLSFSAGFELHEALGPAHVQQEKNDDAWGDALMTEPGVPAEPLEGMGISQFRSQCGSDHLLEAVVANACLGVNSVKSGTSFCELSESVVTTENSPQTSLHAKHACVSAGGPNGDSSLVEVANYKTSTWGSTEMHVRSRKELSSTTLSTCSEQLGGQVQPAKVSKKRARPGETCRPRPRDRQLIQDRIKDLRELVPNGLKCSIDSLLEHTIKHMLFLQSLTKHADNLKKCAESMLQDKGIDSLGSCRPEYGSSWVLEVGSQAVCPIVVENLNMNRQMLVEMLCEECSLFFDIAEVLRGLGLTILKGVTKVRGEKTWASFIVESKKGFQRMDILWSLMPLLQPKTMI
ncbi:transcription factor EMB1444-like isoform X2 [Macadamia integrifolia]|uniref:transcription factor EMB1444-like isoform X2 n=1 Tax=Macadamia integrifolia TaxID=60698 RepID=UPI001C4EAB8C|nr:transcription factor EMB1444-like isoform X2 [Macadamia integrifolia]